MIIFKNNDDEKNILSKHSYLELSTGKQQLLWKVKWTIKKTIYKKNLRSFKETVTLLQKQQRA